MQGAGSRAGAGGSGCGESKQADGAVQKTKEGRRGRAINLGRWGGQLKQAAGGGQLNQGCLGKPDYFNTVIDRGAAMKQIRV